MALDSSFQKEHRIREFLEGNVNVPVHKTCSDDLNGQFPLEIPPILFEETSHREGLHDLHAGDVYSISLLHDEVEDANCPSPLTFLSVLELPNQTKSPLCLDAHMNCQNCIDFQMKSKDEYSQCVINIHNGNGSSVSPDSYQEAVESFKNGNSPTSVLLRESSMKLGGKHMQSLVNVSNPKDKPVAEKLHDLPSNRWRRYKRAASFDSRKVALLFSILSSLGTLVLIYLTLRVRQRADGFVLI